MAGRQRTFELVPTTLVNPSGPKPPMTSKAAKKAYQKASRGGPRITQAERRRADAAELARQKKEYEKQQNAARAKAAREKKAAKAQAERETRRKMGLPEPSKYVRASQPTISRFVRSGSKRTWEGLDDITEDSDATLDGLPGDIPAKRMAVDNDSDDEFGEFPALSQPDILEKLDSSLVSIKEEKVVSKPPSPNRPKLSAPKLRKSSVLRPVTSEKDTRATVTSKQNSDIPKPAHLKKEPSDVEFGEPPSLSQCDRLERDISSATPPIKADPAIPKVHIPKIENERELRTGNKSQAVPVAASSDEFPAVTSQEVADMAATQLLSEAANAMTKSARKDSTPLPLPSKPTPGGPAGSLRIANQRSSNKTMKNQEGQTPSKVASSHRLALKERPVNMPPPSIPFKAKKAISFAPSPNKTRPTILPSATECPKTPPNMPPSAIQAFLEENIDDIYPSPSQQLRELFEEADDIPSNSQVAREISPSKPALDDAFANLFSTQDVSLSAEDLLEITTPSRIPTKQEETAPAPAPEAPQEKRRFFEEKVGDLIHAALHESKILAAAHGVQNNAPSKEEHPSRAKRTLQRVKSNTSDYGDDFSGCSQELLALP
jgi:hypothetical protein